MGDSTQENAQGQRGKTAAKYTYLEGFTQNITSRFYTV